MDFESFVLAAATADPEEAPAARPHADALEFRMDLADEPLAALDGYAADLPVIATNRVDREGGGVPEGPERLDTLRRAAEHPSVEAIDVELSAVDEGDGADVVDHAADHGVATVVSAHDFETTPGRNRMADVLSRAAAVGDVGKLAVTAHSPDDVLDLLAVTRSLDVEGARVATMAMGDAGRHSRAVAPLYGSRIGYAPVRPADATAPGQYDLATLADLIRRLR